MYNRSMYSERNQGSSTKSTPERLLRLGRDINALGALAIAGLAIAVPGPNVVLAGWAGLNAVQAGGLELLRKKTAKRKQSKKR